MAREPRRIALTTIAQGDAAFSRFASAPLEPEKEPELPPGQAEAKEDKSIRIELKLFETDTNKYPEFNYTRLLYLEKVSLWRQSVGPSHPPPDPPQKKAKKLKQVAPPCNGDAGDPFADNDDDVARIVKELEAKYGNSYATGRSKSRKDDFRDIGMGYDESDSFIDNTEAYDEMIPEEAETLEGGFYINSGALELRNLSKKTYTSRTDAIIKMPDRSRRRIESSSSENSSTSSGDEDENDGDSEDDEDESDSEEDDESEDESDSEEDDSDSESLEDGESATMAKSSSKYKDNQPNQAKVIVTPKSKSTASSSDYDKKPPSNNPVVITSSSSNSPRPNAVENSDTDERQIQAPIQAVVQCQAVAPVQTEVQAQAQALKKVVKTTTVKDMLKAKRDSFLKLQSGTATTKGPVNGELKCISTDVDSSSDSSDSDSVTVQGNGERHDDKQDKEGHDSECSSRRLRLSKLYLVSFPDLRTADTLLSGSLDPNILAAVGAFKEAVRSRDMCGKKLTLDVSLVPLLLKVYELVECAERNDRNMVFAHIEYQLQLPKYYVLRKGKALRAKQEKSKVAGAMNKLQRAVAVVMPKAIANYEMELRSFAEQAAGDVNSELPPKMPRKKFQWTSELRLLLYDVYQARWTSYAVLAQRKDSLDEFINGFLRDKVVDLWPQGWMRYDELQREITRHKVGLRKIKEKAKAAPLVKNGEAAPAAEQVPVAEEPRSLGNSDTDSVTSASSTSLKRKLHDPPQQPSMPTKKKAAKPALNMQLISQATHFQMTPAAAAAITVPTSASALAAAITNSSSRNNNHLPSLEALLYSPSTSAQAAALSANNVVLDLVTPNRKSDPLGGSSIYNLITAATLGASVTHDPLALDGRVKTVVGPPPPHVINLDDYQGPGDILYTSKQLASTSSVITSASSSKVTSNRESSSESDGVEIVGVFPASKPKQNAASKAKTKSHHRARNSVGHTSNSGQSNGAIGGYNTKNMYIYNNNNSGSLGPVYDLTTDTQIMRAMSDLK
ncbi:hypothetical protein KR018_005322, partial [Drosophila ironensis]